MPVTPNNQTRQHYPITISVGYQWPKGGGKASAGGPRWQFLYGQIKAVVASIFKIQSKRKGSNLVCRINRLRAMHGGSVLDVLLDRIRKSDILVFDISDLNPNVFVEIGMALALKGCDGRVFIFQEVDKPDEPINKVGKNTLSDLSGYFFTRYLKNAAKGGMPYCLLEPQGFAAAMRSRIIDAARDRQVWRESTRILDDDLAGGS